MQYIESFSDFRHDLSCVQCGAPKDGRPFTRDHLPTKSLLDRPFPTDLPTLDICGECNNALSRDEEYLKVLLACMFDDTVDPAKLTDEKVGRALARNGSLLAQMREARRTYSTMGGEERVFWQPDVERLTATLLKNARGHFAYELAEHPDGEPSSVGVAPLQNFDHGTREAFEAVSIGAGWPEVDSRMMDRLVSGRDLSSGWIVVQPGVYRYAIHQYQAVRVVVREYLAFEAFWTR